MPPAASAGIGETRGARLKAAAATARAPWLLFLRPGTVPDATWIDETRRFIEEAELLRPRRQPSRRVPPRPWHVAAALGRGASVLRRALGPRPPTRAC